MKLVDIECEKRVVTDRAIQIFDGDKTVWLPLSQVEVEPKGKRVVVTMPEWLALEKGLI